MAVKEALSGRGHQPWCCGQIFLVIIPGLTLDLQYGGQGGSVWAGTPALVLWSNLSGHHSRADLGMTERPCLRVRFLDQKYINKQAKLRIIVTCKLNSLKEFYKFFNYFNTGGITDKIRLKSRVTLVRIQTVSPLVLTV